MDRVEKVRYCHDPLSGKLLHGENVSARCGYTPSDTLGGCEL